MKYWMNEIPTQECYLPDGRKIQMDFVTDPKGYGFLATDVGYVNNQISNAIHNHIGGWSETTSEVFNDALKKKQQEPPAKPKWFRADSLLANQDPNALAGRVGAGRGVEVPLQPRPDPIRVPTAEQMKPRKGPIPREAII